MIESAAVLGRYSNSAASYKEQMEKVGFENVTEIQNKWPTGRWPKDPKMKEIGEFCLWILDFEKERDRGERI